MKGAYLFKPIGDQGFQINNNINAPLNLANYYPIVYLSKEDILDGRIPRYIYSGKKCKPDIYPKFHLKSKKNFLKCIEKYTLVFELVGILIKIIDMKKHPL